ncbi:nitroreductase family deazaflavin-dependent oxidoreductase [Streptomyces sp. ISL-43]|uniref:nitroreductase family deazaflavin-dependent oxidoreductase n=1 Tax=Streptomyces sp. ISL-43 TaxID=2819183 RepID=UPI001BE62458|nr:nitroreductase family deazaflavin-dependent oxidoreductase [Streptomyces sp. ISL-43]MBT2448282.1 nitroreductase family deazaflavin-dependent oxidoreductase [Streptomyces sp. ISL-43]
MSDIDWDNPIDPKPGWTLDHVKLYIGSGGTEGQYWNNTQTLLLTTIGRKSGKPVRTPLIYGEDDGRYLIVASKGGDPADPLWYLNLTEHPEVRVQVGPKVVQGVARTANSEERTAFWPLMVKHWPSYDEYQAKTHREIPIVVIDPAS